MNKKEKRLIVFKLIYICLLAFLLLSILPIIIVKNEVLTKIIILLFIAILIIGYFVIVILNMNTYLYICPKCKKPHKLAFREALFSKRGATGRILFCPYCKEKLYMERETK